MTTYYATIIERGNGLAGAGEYATADDNIYRIVKTYGPIHTGAPGEGNYIHAIVEDADWGDVEDGDDPYCTATIGGEVGATVAKVRIGRWTGPMSAARALMDDDLCDAIHGTVDTDQEFADAYCAAHAAKYGTDFVVA